MGASPRPQTPGMEGAAQAPFDALAAESPVPPGADACGLDRAAYTAIYRAELAWTVNTLRRLGVATPDLQDAAQKVFTEVWKQRATYDRQRPVKPWLFGFAYRVVGDYQRGAWRKRAVFEEVDTTCEGESGEEAVDAERNRRLVLAALDALDIDRRAVFVMSEIDGASAPEVATALGIPLGTVYSRLRVAREEFAAAVKRLRSRRGER